MSIHSVVIIGSGPAAHTAAIYAGRAALKPVLFEGEMAAGVAAGGLLTTTTDVENFPGFPDGIAGLDLTDRLRKQSEKCGTTIYTKTVARVDLSERPFKVYCEDETEPMLTQSIIVATGSSPRTLTCPGASKFWQHGISTCAVCDGALPLFRNQVLVVVGGGDSACEEAMYLSKHASRVLLVHRRDKLRASAAMIARVAANPKIECVWNSEITEICGDKLVKSVILRNTIDKDAELRTIEVRGVFVAIGHVPNTGFLGGQVALDSDGYIITRSGGFTNVEGVWAAGDVQDRHYKQAVTAAASGCMAALECERWLGGHLGLAGQAKPPPT